MMKRQKEERKKFYSPQRILSYCIIPDAAGFVEHFGYVSKEKLISADGSWVADVYNTQSLFDNKIFSFKE